MTNEDNLLAAAEQAKAEIAKIKAWYKQFPFYAGLVLGAIGATLIRHWL